jgi:hypothetical protein
MSSPPPSLPPSIPPSLSPSSLPPPLAQIPPSLVTVSAPTKFPAAPPPFVGPSPPATRMMSVDLPARPPRTSLRLSKPLEEGAEANSGGSTSPRGLSHGSRFHSPPPSTTSAPVHSGSHIGSARGPAPPVPDFRPRVSVDLGEMKRQGRTVQNRTLVAQETLYLNDLGTWIQDRGKLDDILQGEGKGKEDEKKKKEKKKSKSKRSNIFGMSLEEMYAEHSSAVPVIILECIKYFKKSGALKQEGIFRVSGNQSNVNELINLYVTPSSSVNLIEVVKDPNDVASLFKKFFRDLPSGLVPPLITDALFDLFKNKDIDLDERILKTKGNNTPFMIVDVALGIHWNQSLLSLSFSLDTLSSLSKIFNLDLIRGIPVHNIVLLRLLCEFFHKITIYSEVNKMTSDNLGIVIGPSILRPGVIDPIIASLQLESKIASFLINHNEVFEDLGENVGTYLEVGPDGGTTRKSLFGRKDKKKDKEKDKDLVVSIPVLVSSSNPTGFLFLSIITFSHVLRSDWCIDSKIFNNGY